MKRSVPVAILTLSLAAAAGGVPACKSTQSVSGVRKVNNELQIEKPPAG